MSPQKLPGHQGRNKESVDRVVAAQAYVKLNDFPEELRNELKFEQLKLQVHDIANILAQGLAKEVDASARYKEGSLIIQVDICISLMDALSPEALVGFDILSRDLLDRLKNARDVVAYSKNSIADAVARLNRIYKKTADSITEVVLALTKKEAYQRHKGNISVQSRTPGLGTLARFWDSAQVARVKGVDIVRRGDAMARTSQYVEYLTESVPQYEDRKFLCEYIGAVLEDVPAPEPLDIEKPSQLQKIAHKQYEESYLQAQSDLARLCKL